MTNLLLNTVIAILLGTAIGLKTEKKAAKKVRIYIPILSIVVFIIGLVI